MTELHRRFIDNFYIEVFSDYDNLTESRNPQPSIPRKKIRAFLANRPENDADRSTIVELNKSIHQVYSGFVHAASPQIMDMYGGSPAKFHVEGVPGTPIQEAANRDLANYIDRCLVSLMMSCKAFGLADMLNQLKAVQGIFDQMKNEN